MDEYNEGQKAFYNGKDIEDNPYEPQDPSHDKWESGYSDADIRESGDYG